MKNLPQAWSLREVLCYFDPQDISRILPGKQRRMREIVFYNNGTGFSPPTCKFQLQAWQPAQVNLQISKVNLQIPKVNLQISRVNLQTVPGQLANLPYQDARSQSQNKKVWRLCVKVLSMSLWIGRLNLIPFK